MAEAKKAIPDQYHTITPHIVVRNAAQAIEFYKKALGAEELYRMPGPGGMIMHAEIKIGNSIVMMADENPQMGDKSPQTLGGTTGGLMMYCENVDQAYDRMVKAGGTSEMPPADMFWGDRYCRVRDPFGHSWALATHVRDVTPEEMQKAMMEMAKQQGPK